MYLVVNAKNMILAYGEIIEKDGEKIYVDKTVIYNTKNFKVVKVKPSHAVPEDLAEAYRKYFYFEDIGFVINDSKKENTIKMDVASTLMKIAEKENPNLINVSGGTIDDYKNIICSIISKTGTELLENGIQVFLPIANRIEHFACTNADQLNLLATSVLINDDVETISYHADNDDCMEYAVDDFKVVFSNLMLHRLFHCTLMNQLHRHVKDDLKTIEEVKQITYSSKLPENRFQKLINTIYKNAIAIAKEIHTLDSIEEFILYELKSIVNYQDTPDCKCTDSGIIALFN